MPRTGDAENLLPAYVSQGQHHYQRRFFMFHYSAAALLFTLACMAVVALVTARILFRP